MCLKYAAVDDLIRNVSKLYVRSQVAENNWGGWAAQIMMNENESRRLRMGRKAGEQPFNVF